DSIDPFFPRWWPERLRDIPHDWNTLAGRQHVKPRGIFLDDMSDWMGPWWPEEWTRQEIQAMIDNPQHRFYTLTKWPQNLIKFSPFPPNCWVGQTITSQTEADRTFNDFAKVEASIKYVSLEPLLGRIDITPYLKGWVNAGTIFENPEGVERYDIDGALVNHIDWVIIGAQTRPTVFPKIEWVQERVWIYYLEN
ncbi:unnamed protein product, partial [marine sediment metagenome]